MVLTKEDTVVIKGIAILMMLLHHLWGFPEQSYGINIPVALVSLGKSGKLCVAIFMVLSGYGLTRGFNRKTPDANVTNRITNRIVKLYVRYWRVALPFSIIGILIGYFDFKLQYALGTIVCIIYPYNGMWWYIFTYALMLIVFPAIVGVKTKIFVWIFPIICIFSFVLGEYIPKEGWVLTNLHYFFHYLGHFVIGMALARYDIKWPPHCFAILQWKCIQVLVIASLLLVFFWLRKTTGMTIYTLAIVPLFIGLCKLLMPVLPKRLLTIFGRYSMDMWLVHGFFSWYYLSWCIYELTSNFIIAYLLLVTYSFITAYFLTYIYSLHSLWSGSRKKDTT